MAERNLGRRTLGVLGAVIGGGAATTTLVIRMTISFDHESWFLAGLTAVALVGTFAVTGAIVTGLVRNDAADRRAAHLRPEPAVDRWLHRIGPLMIGIIGVGTLAALSGDDWFWGYLSVGLVVAWCLTFALLIQREQARALWGLLTVSVVVVAVGAIGLPATARLRIAEPEIAAAGSQVLAGESPTRAGSYRIVRSFTDGGCAVMITQEILFDRYGIAYCDGAPDSGFLSSEFGQIYSYSHTD